MSRRLGLNGGADYAVTLNSAATRAAMDPERSYYRHVSDIVEKLRPGAAPARGARLAWNRRTIKRVVVVVALFSCVLAAIAYAGDYAVARYRLAHGYGLGSVKVVRLYAIPQKSGKTEFEEGGEEVRTCVRSWFPHFGYAPCWYVNRHSEQRTNF